MIGRDLGVLVIGLGIGRAHLRAYQAIEGVRIAAISDVNAAALAKAKDEFGSPFVSTDFREAIDRPDVDLVSICTPDRFHAEQAIYALQHGKHVICEKPIATTAAEVAQLVQAVDSSGLTFAAGHNYRFIPQFRALHDAVTAGDIGRPFLVDSAYIQDLWDMRSLGPDYWRFKDPQDLFIGGAVHNVDLLQWLAGEITEVHAYANNVLDFWPVENNYTTNLKFRSGCIGHVLLELGARRKTKFDVQLRAFGIEGSLEANNRQAQVVREIGAAPGDLPEVMPVAAANSHELELRHFVDCVRSGQHPLVDVHEAARVMSVCFAAVKSARQGSVATVEGAF